MAGVTLAGSWRCLLLPPAAARCAPRPVAGLAPAAAALQLQLAGRTAAAAAAAALPRRRRAAAVCWAAAGATVDVETARKLLDGPHMVLDIRPAREYEDNRITKPPRRSVNVPFAAGQDPAGFVAQVSSKFTNKAAKLIVMCASGGQDSAQAVEALAAAGYTDVAQMEGGYAGYCQVWSPSGKRRPPAGRWVSTGKEALKSGLNIPGVAESYDEGGNLITARYAQGLPPGETLLEPLPLPERGQQ